MRRICGTPSECLGAKKIANRSGYVLRVLEYGQQLIILPSIVSILNPVQSPADGGVPISQPQLAWCY